VVTCARSTSGVGSIGAVCLAARYALITGGTGSLHTIYDERNGESKEEHTLGDIVVSERGDTSSSVRYSIKICGSRSF